MESIQEAERQLNQLNEIRTVVDARNDAATMASYAKVCVLVFQYLLMCLSVEFVHINVTFVLKTDIIQ